MDFNLITSFIREQFKEKDAFIPLHAPYFGGNEKKYVLDTIDSTFVSSVGEYVNLFEKMMCEYTGAKFCIATTNGTSALHLAMLVAGVEYNDEVITQPLTFIATANAISHAGAIPVFVDVDRDTMGLSPEALQAFLEESCTLNEKNECVNKVTSRRIKACVPMHTFGFPARIKSIAAICERYNLQLIEDAAESLGSFYEEKHTGRYGILGTFSFNGNKTITCGGGGAIITDNENLARKAKHLSTTAKIPHSWEFRHDAIGYNYRLPNLNAALACAQLEQLNAFLDNKRDLAAAYRTFFSDIPGIHFISHQPNTVANYWLNTLLFDSPEQKDAFLDFSNQQKVMTRPIWQLMNSLPMYEKCPAGPLTNAEWLVQRVVNIPSSVRNFKAV